MDALQDIEKVLELDPKNTEAKALRRELKSDQRRADKELGEGLKS